MSTTHLDCFPFGLLLLVRIHDVCQKPTFAVLVLCLFLVLLNGSLIHTVAEVKDAAARRRLAGINVTYEDNVHVSAGIGELQLTLVHDYSGAFSNDFRLILLRLVWLGGCLGLLRDILCRHGLRLGGLLSLLLSLLRLLRLVLIRLVLPVLGLLLLLLLLFLIFLVLRRSLLLFDGWRRRRGLRLLFWGLLGGLLGGLLRRLLGLWLRHLRSRRLLSLLLLLLCLCSLVLL
mmetsp:Transcript_18583/g.40609  ORF Transcript_18583/g.40609 Transcript_18583/m.40609 type:complete len:231 (+) Transcript_18583:1264-1956(+)